MNEWKEKEKEKNRSRVSSCLSLGILQVAYLSSNKACRSPKIPWLFLFVGAKTSMCTWKTLPNFILPHLDQIPCSSYPIFASFGNTNPKSLEIYLPRNWKSYSTSTQQVIKFKLTSKVIWMTIHIQVRDKIWYQRVRLHDFNIKSS